MFLFRWLTRPDYLNAFCKRVSGAMEGYNNKILGKVNLLDQGLAILANPFNGIIRLACNNF